MAQLFTRTGTARIANTVSGVGYAYTPKCGRCGGAGGSDAWKFTGWTCFECQGTGLGQPKVDKLYTAEENARLDAMAAKRAATKATKQAVINAARDAEIAHQRVAFLADNAAFIAKLDGLDGEFWDGFRKSFLERACAPTFRQEEIVDLEVAKRAKAPSMHVGSIGEKITLKLTCEKVIRIDSQFGSTLMNLCRDANGNVVVYKGNVDFLRQGETGEVKATVKDHTVYNNTAQTLILRPKIFQAA